MKALSAPLCAENCRITTLWATANWAGSSDATASMAVIGLGCTGRTFGVARFGYRNSRLPVFGEDRKNEGEAMIAARDLWRTVTPAARPVANRILPMGGIRGGTSLDKTALARVIVPT